MNDKFFKKVQYFTGMLFVLSAIMSFCQFFMNYYRIAAIFSTIGILLMAASMFTGMYQLLMAGAGVQIVASIIELVSFIQGTSSQRAMSYVLSYIFLALGYAVVALAACQKKTAFKYGLISVAPFMVGVVLSYTHGFGFWSAVQFSVQDFLIVVSPIIMAFIVLENVPQAQTTRMVKQSPKTVKSDNRIEELTKLKDLLDTGVITQEEFDAKKKQILGL